MNDPEYPDDWPLVPLADADRRLLMPAVIGAYVVAGAAALFPAVLITIILDLLVASRLVVVSVSAVLLTGAGFAGYRLARSIAGSFGRDLQENRKVVFTGILTEIGETRFSRIHREFGDGNGKWHAAVIDGRYPLRCRVHQYREFSDHTGSRVLLEMRLAEPAADESGPAPSALTD